MSIEARRIAARTLRVMAPGYGSCLCCGTPWKFASEHSTIYKRTIPERRGREVMRCSSSRGMFPLCEACWRDLGTPAARLPYYEALVRRWAADGFDRSELTREYLMECLELEAA